MIKGRHLTALGIASAASLALAGCASSAPADSDEKIELSMLVNVTPNLTEEYWNDLVAPFEKEHENIDVVIQNPGAEGVHAAVPRLLAAGDAPDIVQSMAPTTEIAPELVDLSEYDWATSGPLAEQYTIDGKYYMAGIGVQLQSLFFYNKTAFAEAGITEAPATVDELTEALGKLKAAGWTPVQTGGDWMTSHTLQTLGLPSIITEYPDWFQEMSAGELTFGDTYAEAVDTYAEWVAQGYIPKEALGIKYPDAEQAFLSGKTAVYSMGSWFAGTQANAAESADIGVFRAPAFDAGTQPSMGANIASPYSIMKSSEHQDAAAELIEFLVTDQEAVSSQLAVDGNFRDGYEYEMTPLGEELLEIVADTPADAYTPTGNGYGERTLPSEYSNELNTQTQALIGGTPAQEMLDAMDAWFLANAN
ncbi:ABC transporter substrate-binding protein [Microbacterium sp. M28]|uniref:ABC transporter substrate-binding protein n=1 Tax=Microbacterium sp. M28 TaxID=2962064 RepID=UPI0021F4ACC4|nr:ABC transporter substrate-binding protein [Microbacterium sp. M28]UYO97452.1 ABC transporter substrate-binding protein [Microbacterium sp. M28]